MSIAEQGGDRVRRLGHLVVRRDADADRPDRVARHEVLAHRGQRNEDFVVGILEPRAALRLEDPDHGERQPADLDRRSDRGRIQPEIRRRRRTEDGDAQAAIGEGARQERALPDVVRTDLGVRRARPNDRGRGRLRPRHDRLRRLQLGRDGGDAVDLADRRCVLEGQRRGRRAAGRADGQEVRAETGEPRRDVRGRPLADAHEGDHRRDADDDPEHGQGRPETARPEARECEPKELEGVHAAIIPSRMWTWRSAAAATSWSWVIRTIVRPVA